MCWLWRLQTKRIRQAINKRPNQDAYFLQFMEYLGISKIINKGGKHVMDNNEEYKYKAEKELDMPMSTILPIVALVTRGPSPFFATIAAPEAVTVHCAVGGF